MCCECVAVWGSSLLRGVEMYGMNSKPGLFSLQWKTWPPWMGPECEWVPLCVWGVCMWVCMCEYACVSGYVCNGCVDSCVQCVAYFCLLSRRYCQSKTSHHYNFTAAPNIQSESLILMAWAYLTFQWSLHKAWNFRTITSSFVANWSVVKCSNVLCLLCTILHTSWPNGPISKDMPVSFLLNRQIPLHLSP